MASASIIRKAISIAKQSPAETFLHSAIIHIRGKFVTGSCNLPFKTVPGGGGPHSSGHSEIRAIRKARAILNRNDLTGCSIYVMRLNRLGEFRLSKPCNVCAKLIKESNLKVQWTCDAF